MAGSSPLSAIAWEVNGSLDAASQTPLPTGERALRDPQESPNFLLLDSMGFFETSSYWHWSPNNLSSLWVSDWVDVGRLPYLLSLELACRSDWAGSPSVWFYTLVGDLSLTSRERAL